MIRGPVKFILIQIKKGPPSPSKAASRFERDRKRASARSCWSHFNQRPLLNLRVALLIWINAGRKPLRPNYNQSIIRCGCWNPEIRGTPAPKIVVSGFRAGKRRPGRCPVTIPSEHSGYGIGSVVERVTIVAIVVSGMAVIVLWVYLLW